MSRDKTRILEALRSSATAEAKQRACKDLWSLGPDGALTALQPLLQSTDIRLVEAAAYSIAQSPSVEADLVLISALDHAREKALVPLIALAGERRLDGAVPKLIAILNAGPKPVAEAAQQALGKIATPAAIEALRSHKSEHALLQAAQELAHRGYQKEGTELLSHLAAQATAEPVRRGAAGVLRRTQKDADGFEPLWNGVNLDDFIVDTASVWSIRNGIIIGKSAGLTYNEFLRTRKHYTDFELKFRLRLINGFGNSGVQFRSKPVPDSHEVSGYQADAGERFWGALYDESRRRKTLADPPPEFIEKLDPTAWHRYAVTAKGAQIGINVDGVQTVRYEEKDPDIDRIGFIALQVHSSKAPIEVWFADLRIRSVEA